MKKTIMTLILAGLLTASLASCNNEQVEKPDTGNETQVTENNKTAIADPVALLETVWNSYGDDEKFAVIGGDFSEENNKSDAPGRYSVSDAEAIDSSLGIPAASVSKIDDAASVIHMMNANTFTAGVYRLKDGEDAGALTDEIKANIEARNWMCGFPDKLIIATVDNYVVSAFGANELIDTFKTKLTDAYDSASVTVEQSLA